MATQVLHALCSTTYWNNNIVEMEARYGINNYYTTLVSWESSEQRNLISLDEVAIIECYNDPNLGTQSYTTVIGWTTDATRNIIIRAAEGHECNGLFGSAYTIQRLRLRERYTEVHGIIVDYRGNNSTGVMLNVTHNNCLIKNCIVMARGTHGCIRLKGKMINCLAICNVSDRRDAVSIYSNNSEIINCNLFKGRASVNSRGRVVSVTNTLSFWANNTEFNGSNFTLTTNASDSGASFPRAGVIPIDIDPSDFIDVATNNFVLSPTSRLKEEGTTTIHKIDINNVLRI